MNEQQNINDNSKNHILSQNYNDMLKRKIEGISKAKKFVKISAILSSTWVSCFILFIILIIIAAFQVSLNTTSNNIYTPIDQNISILNGTGITAIVFLAIGITCTFVSFFLAIISIVIMFSAGEENNFMFSNQTTYINKSLNSPKILAIIGVVICGTGFGTIFFWITNSQLGNVINSYKQMSNINYN